MKQLGKEQQELILDFYFRCGQQNDIEKGRDLIAGDPEAAKFYAGLEQTLTDLDNLKYEPCPDNLVDLTIARLKLAAKSTSHSRLKELLEEQQQVKPLALTQRVSKSKETSSGKRGSFFVRPVFELLATAASIALVAGMLFPGLGAMRAHSQQVACARNMGSVGTAFASFTNDNNDRVSDLTLKAGSPWWKTGDQRPAAQSSSRPWFGLIKGEYIKPEAFICNGDKHAQPLPYNPASMNELLDFPSRNNFSYSYMIFCEKSPNLPGSSSKIIASDRNPVFVPVLQKIPCDPDIYQRMNEFEKIILNEQLKQMMSMNHRGRGQNVLYSDGAVVYIKTRMIDGDDIFTVTGVGVYTGCETPSSEDDVFLVP